MKSRVGRNEIIVQAPSNSLCTDVPEERAGPICLQWKCFIPGKAEPICQIIVIILDWIDWREGGWELGELKIPEKQ